MPLERPSAQRQAGKPGRLSTWVRRSRSVLRIVGESLAEERRREQVHAAAEPLPPERPTPEVHTMPPPGASAGTTPFNATTSPVERDVQCSAPSVQGALAGQSPGAHPGAEPLAQALHARFGLVEQRLAILSERLELLGERVDAIRLAAQPRAAPDAHGVQETLQRLAERLSSLETRSSATQTASTTPFAEGTLRPPKVPSGLEMPLAAAPSAAPFAAGGHGSGFGGSSFGASGGFAERASRPARKFDAGPVLSGTISGLSLGSLFSLFEFERSTGTLSIHNEARRLDLSLRSGSVVRCELDGTRTPASSAVREAFSWPMSTFSFQRDLDEDDSEPPQSVNALMLEAMRFHDEELRTG